MRAGKSLVLAAVAAACGACASACGGGVQRATLSPSVPDAQLVRGPALARIVVEPPSSLIVVAARDVARGSHPLSFERFRGTLDVDGAGRGTLRVEIDTEALRASSPFAESLAHSMLEVARFPQATLVARVDRGDSADADARLVTGNVTVHGVERGIVFRARVRHEGDAWRLSAGFDRSRRAFGIKADGAWDPLIRDDFRVTLDLRGAPEAAHE